MRPCPCCNGTGQLEGEGITGLDLKVLRISRSVSTKDLATEMKISDTMVCLVEGGRRGLTDSFLARYLTAVEDIVARQ